MGLSCVATSGVCLPNIQAVRVRETAVGTYADAVHVTVHPFALAGAYLSGSRAEIDWRWQSCRGGGEDEGYGARQA